MIKKIFTCFLLCSKLFALNITSGIFTLSDIAVQSTPELVVSTGGRGAAVWTEGIPFQVNAAAFDGTNWLPTISFPGTLPQIDIDADGNAIAVWLETKTSQIFASRFDINNSTWTTHQISFTGTNASPQIIMNSAGQAIAIWVDTISNQVFASRYDTNNSSWITQPISQTGINNSPQIAIDSMGNALVVWVVAGAPSQLAGATLDATNNNIWSAPVTLSTTGGSFRQVGLSNTNVGVIMYTTTSSAIESIKVSVP